MHAHFDPADLRAALKLAYSDTGDTTDRSTITHAWAKISSEKLAGALGETVQQYHDHPGSYNSALIKNTIGADTRTLGLLTGADQNSFGDSVAAANEAAAHRKEVLDSLAGLIPVPDAPELGGALGKITSTVWDSTTEMLKGSAIDALSPTQSDDVVNAHTDQTSWDSLNQTDAYPKYIVTAMSHAGLPVIDSGHTATSVADDPNHQFTDSQGHLLTPDQILKKGPQSVQAFDEWWARSDFTEGHDSATELDSTFQSQYQAGKDSAMK